METTRQFFTLDSIETDMVKYNGQWLMVVALNGIDVDMMTDFQQKSTLETFRGIVRSFNIDIQTIFKKEPLNFLKMKKDIRTNIESLHSQTLKEYGESYLEYLSDATNDKLTKENLIVLKTDKKCNYDTARSFLGGIFDHIKEELSAIGIPVSKIVGEELSVLFCQNKTKECLDYMIYGNRYRRTYVVCEYPRSVHPNWLKPILNFKHPIEVTQHYHPFPKDNVIKSLEISIAKFESTIELQRRDGDTVSSEIKVKLNDTRRLLNLLASGEDKLMDVSFYLTVSANDLTTLDNISIELESYMRQVQLKARRCRKEMNKAFHSILPLCSDKKLETHTLDTRSLSTIVPFTTQDFTSKKGIVFGMNNNMSEIISIDRFGLPNQNMIVLGKSGFGKSMFSKIETARQIIDGASAIIIDHNKEWNTLCKILGGQYVYDDTENINWDHHMIVFGGNKKNALLRVWDYIQNSPLSKRLLVIEEFHTILRSDSSLIVEIVQQIRKTFVAPTFITQNIRGLLMSDEGKMIADLCSIKVLLRQGENDLEDIKNLFSLSDMEKMYLATCSVGRGYLITDLFKTRFKVDYSAEEEKILTTNPAHLSEVI